MPNHFHCRSMQNALAIHDTQSPCIVTVNEARSDRLTTKDEVLAHVSRSRTHRAITPQGASTAWAKHQ
jgi:hypothetical protein